MKNKRHTRQIREPGGKQGELSTQKTGSRAQVPHQGKDRNWSVSTGCGLWESSFGISSCSRVGVRGSGVPKQSQPVNEPRSDRLKPGF